MIPHPVYHIMENDTTGNKPLRIQLHTFDMTVQYRGFGFTGSTSYAHRERILMINSHQMERWYIDNHIFFVLPGIIILSPAATFHVAENFDSHRLAQSSSLQFLQQLIIERILRLYFFQKGSHRVTSNHLHSLLIERIICMSHFYIKQTSEPNGSLDTIIRIGSKSI